MSFLFEDDEPYSQEQSFVCENCGSSESYFDAVAGKDVCQNCFTQSQQINSQTVAEDTVDYEEMMGLAARTRGGMLIRQKNKKEKQSKRHPIEDLNRAVTLPTLEQCLDGMKTVFKACAKKLGILLKLEPDAADSLLRTVQHLWVSYLKAYADAAQHYGTLYPEVRFCLRDSFLPQTKLKSQLMQQLAYNAADKIREDDRKRGRETDEVDPGPTRKAARPMMQVIIERLVTSTHRKGDRYDYRDCALVLQPDMDFVAALLWLAVAKSGVPSSQISQWIADNAIPLQNAFLSLLRSKQRVNLRLVRSHFEMTLLISTEKIEHIAQFVAAVCRMRSQDTYISGPLKDTFAFWSKETFPLVVARLVANAGLGQDVLNRSLALLDLPLFTSTTVSLPLPIPKTKKTTIHCISDVLAVIAIACQMDPDWRKWSFRRNESQPIPVNECHMTNLSNRDFEEYLQFGVEKYSDPTKSLLWDGFEELDIEARNDKDRSSLKHGRSLQRDLHVTPCTIVAGSRVSEADIAKCQKTVPNAHKDIDQVGRDQRQDLLVDFLSYTARANRVDVHGKLQTLLSVIRESESARSFVTFFTRTDEQLTEQQARDLICQEDNVPSEE